MFQNGDKMYLKLHQKLNIHIAFVHEGKRPFKCNICSANFSEKKNLNGHNSSVHEGKNLLDATIVVLAFHRSTT